jgi:hypothetical protein
MFRRVARDALDHHCGVRRLQSTLPAAVAAVATVAVVAVAVAVAIAVAAVAVAVAVAAAKAAAAPVRLIIISGPALSRARAASTPLGLALRPVEVLEAAQHVRGGRAACLGPPRLVVDWNNAPTASTLCPWT